MSSGGNRESAWAIRINVPMTRQEAGPPPVGFAHRLPRTAPKEPDRIVQSKGFEGGVPLNTERTTVKPWVGI